MRKKTLIIAEAGVNHNGDFELAKRLVDVAVDAGADIVKFQTFKADKLVSPSAKKAQYQIKNINDGDNSQYAMLKKLEMPEHWHLELMQYCENKKIKFLSTAFDERSVDFLASIGIDLFKIPSGEITNKPYLQHIARKSKSVILSTGMANLAEVTDAILVMEKEGLSREHIAVLHCNTEYPTPMIDVNLKAMNTIRHELGVVVGYSDHTMGIEVPIAAVALGAQIIEKHFTLDKTMPGPDHKASLEPHDLVAMVKAIRNIEEAISGDGIKAPSPSEINNIAIVRKSLHYAMNLEAGHTLRMEDFIAIRPGDGVSPMQIESLMGLKLVRAVAAFQQTRKDDMI